jgi:IMP cyclohydrolase
VVDFKTAKQAAQKFMQAGVQNVMITAGADGDKSVQAYWVMGRSDNSKNRVLIQDKTTVRTQAFDESKMTDPSLVIYNAMVETYITQLINPTADHCNTTLFIVSNGDQTDSVRERASNPYYYDGEWQGSFQQALLKREFEPDAPNFTPRITGMLAVRESASYDRYYYSIIRRNPSTERPEHAFGQGDLARDIPSGAGICFHTYEGDGNPLPAFEGSPYAVPLESNAEEIAGAVWQNLNYEKRVALAIKTIDKKSGEVEVKIINQLELAV